MGKLPHLHTKKGKRSVYWNAINETRRRIVRQAIDTTHGNRRAAARWLGITYGQLYYLLHHLEIRTDDLPKAEVGGWNRGRGIKPLYEQEIMRVWKAYKSAFRIQGAPRPNVQCYELMLNRLMETWDVPGGKAFRVDHRVMIAAIEQAKKSGLKHHYPKLHKDIIATHEQMVGWLEGCRGIHGGDQKPEVPRENVRSAGDARGVQPIQRAPGVALPPAREAVSHQPGASGAPDDGEVILTWP